MRLIFCSEINDRSQALTHRLDLLALQDGILCSAMRKHCALHYYACFLIRRASYLKIRVERVGIEDYAVEKSVRPKHQACTGRTHRRRRGECTLNLRICAGQGDATTGRPKTYPAVLTLCLRAESLKEPPTHDEAN